MTFQQFMAQMRVVASCTVIGVMVLAVMWWTGVEQSVQQSLVLQVATAAVAWIIGRSQIQEPKP